MITEQNVVKIEEYAECLLLARQIDDMEENEAHAQSEAAKLIQDARETEEKRHQQYLVEMHQGEQALGTGTPIEE